MKTCSSCKVDKDVKEFSVRKASADGFSSSCKDCVNTRRKSYTSTTEYNKKRYWSNRESEIIRKELWYKKNPSKKKEHRLTYRNKNLEKVRLSENNKYIARKTRIPTWLSAMQKQHIVNIYSLRKEVEMLTGDIYHVDHIVPLQGADVCGLHVPWNLQVLPGDLNLKKSNRFSANNQGGVPQ